MKRYVLSFGAAIEHTPEHPERTAKRDVGWDIEFQVWTNRAAMARTIRMQERRARRPGDWRPCVGLGDGEGF